SASTLELTSATSSIRVSYSGTSTLYISDMARENQARIWSGFTKLWLIADSAHQKGWPHQTMGNLCDQVKKIGLISPFFHDGHASIMAYGSRLPAAAPNPRSA